MTSSYLLHFIGSGLYGAKRFINEAKRLGVQRVVPFSVLRKLTWGSIILLGEHSKVPIDQNSSENIATIFGFFGVRGIVDNLPDEVKESLIESLDIVKVADGGAKRVTRGCGSYIVTASLIVRDSLAQLVQKIEGACEENGVNVGDCRFFLSG